MSVNRIQIKASSEDKKVVVPLGQIFDEVGREQLLEMYDEIELQSNINFIQDYDYFNFWTKINDLSSNIIPRVHRSSHLTSWPIYYLKDNSFSCL